MELFPAAAGNQRLEMIVRGFRSSFLGTEFKPLTDAMDMYINGKNRGIEAEAHYHRGSFYADSFEGGEFG